MGRHVITIAALIAGFACPAQATTSTFGQFHPRALSARLFRYVNEDNGSDKKASIYTTGTANGTSVASIPIYYFTSIFGMPDDLLGLQEAHLTVDLVSNVGTTGSGSSRQQLFDTAVAGTISIIRDSAAAEGNGSRTNLLTISFTNAELDASQHNGAFQFKALDSAAISYTSDFLDFSNVTQRAFALSFTGANPTFEAAIGDSSRNMRFAGTGTFAAGPDPIVVPVPEASSWGMMLIGFGSVGGAMRARRKIGLSFR